jgi:two-component SAPR family response regulator
MIKRTLSLLLIVLTAFIASSYRVVGATQIIQSAVGGSDSQTKLLPTPTVIMLLPVSGGNLAEKPTPPPAEKPPPPSTPDGGGSDKEIEPTDTPTPTNTPRPTSTRRPPTTTNTPTATNTPTWTPTPTATNTPTPTATNTATLAATEAPTSTCTPPSNLLTPAAVTPPTSSLSLEGARGETVPSSLSSMVVSHLLNVASSPPVALGLVILAAVTITTGGRISSRLKARAKTRGVEPTSVAVAEIADRIAAHGTQTAQQTAPAIQVEPCPTLKIYALGQARVEWDGKNVQWATMQSRDLFFCLLQHPQGLRKEEIGDMLWPEHDPERLHSIFRSTLYRLRRVLYPNAVKLTDGQYGLNLLDRNWFDVEAFEKLLDQAERSQPSEPQKVSWLEEALSLYQGDYLPDISASWCVLERERLRGRFLAASEMLAKLYANRGEIQRAIKLYQKALALDRCRETAHRGLMDCYHRLGDRAAAIRQYQTCIAALREELGLDPVPETQELYLQIIN